MSEGIQRVEIYIDDRQEPDRVISEPPFTLRLDTRELSDGSHRLRVVTRFTGGGSDERVVPFEVDNLPGMAVEGLAPGDVVRGTLEVEVKAPDARTPPGATGRPSLLHVAAMVAVLGGVWAFFAFTPPAGQLLAAVSPQAASGPATTPVDHAYLKAGKKIFSQYCASCHQTNGRGIDDAFPPLAGNKNLEDLGLVAETVRTGKTGHVTVEGKSYNSTMPPIGAGFSAKEIAEVGTYIRNSWGNDFGGVTEAQVEKHLAASGGQ